MFPPHPIVVMTYCTAMPVEVHEAWAPEMFQASYKVSDHRSRPVSAVCERTTRFDHIMGRTGFRLHRPLEKNAKGHGFINPQESIPDGPR